jgi:hypothetical protein
MMKQLSVMMGVPLPSIVDTIAGQRFVVKQVSWIEKKYS